MTHIQALYGSQYTEIAQRGKDGNAGRLNGNLFLSVFLVLAMLTVVSYLHYFTSMLTFLHGSFLTDMLEYMSGKTMGKILAIPILGLTYLIVSNTIGSKDNFAKHVEQFLLLPEHEQKQANKKILIPFFVVLALYIVVIASAF